jgi:AraC family transcriptional regulator
MPYWSAFVVEQGEFGYTIGAAEGIAQAGSMVICPPDVPFYRTMPGPMTFHFYVFEWTDEAGAPIMEFCEPFTPQLHFSDRLRLFSSLTLLKEQMQADPQGLRDWKNHLIADTFRLYLSEAHAGPHPFLHRTDDPLMARVRTRIENNYDQPLFVQELADEFGLSPVQLSRRYQRAFGVVPSGHLSQLRLSKACQLLTHTKLSIDDIAVRCGYSNGFYLSRVFSREMKVTPSAYRKAHRV